MVLGGIVTGLLCRGGGGGIGGDDGGEKNAEGRIGKGVSMWVCLGLMLDWM